MVFRSHGNIDCGTPSPHSATIAGQHCVSITLTMMFQNLEEQCSRTHTTPYAIHIARVLQIPESVTLPKIVPNGMKLDGSTMHFPVISITLMLTSISVFPNWGSVDCGPAYIVRVVSVFIVFVFFAFHFFSHLYIHNIYCIVNRVCTVPFRSIS